MSRKYSGTQIGARVASCFLALLFAFFAAVPVLAEPSVESVYPPPALKSDNAFVYNLQYETVLFEQNANELIYPASFAKIMTAVLCYEYREKLGTSVSVTVQKEDDLSVGGLGLIEGEVLDFDTLLNAMVIGSANDAAMVLARAVAGSVEEFVAQMNARAKELGCTDTVFCNPTGLHDGSAQTTLTDMAKVCARAYQINDYMQTSSKLIFEIEPTDKYDKTRRVTNSNLLLNPRSDLIYHVEGAMGINHGYTPQSGYCVSSVRETGGAINLVLIAGGFKNEEKQNTALLDAMALFEYAEKAFEIATVLEKDSVIREVEVALSDTQDYVLLIAGSDISTLLPTGFNRVTDLKERISLNEEVLEAPVIEGTSYGSIDLYYKDTYIGSAELLAQRSLSRSSSLALLNGVENFLQLPVVRLILIILAAALALLLIVCVILLLIQQRRKSGLSHKERRERKRLEKELLFKEKMRQKEYFRLQKETRKKRNAELISQYRKMRAEQKRRQEEALRLADERARKARLAEQARAAAQNRASAPQSRASAPQNRPSSPQNRPSAPQNRPSAPRRTDKQGATPPRSVQTAAPRTAAPARPLATGTRPSAQGTRPKAPVKRPNPTPPARPTPRSSETKKKD